MPAPRSSSSGRSGGSGARKPAARSGASGARKPAARSGGGSRSTPVAAKRTSAGATKTKAKRSGGAAKTTTSRSSSSGSLGDQLTSSLVKPLDLVLISRERIQQTLDEAAERGRVTRADANELVLELVKRGRQQTDDVVREVERMLGRGRDQLESAGKRVRSAEPVDRLVRRADRARRTVGVGPSFPILGYDDLTAGQVDQRLTGLKPAELRQVRDYERRHANRKTVLDAIERALG